jgi:hypothetical protein
MPNMGRYCKAYHAGRFREYGDWTENRENVRKRKEVVDNNEIEVDRDLNDTDVLYLQENYVVTDGVFIDQNIIFDKVTPEWIEFCTSTLDFQLPDYVTEQETETEEKAAAAQAS